MRPRRLELRGFSSFREPVCVDFEGADLFVLTGPTGSGKSSLIDAMVFALYGSVPRYDNKKLVAPVITQGCQEARVCFDFSIAGDQFRVARVVARTSGGATTREARLEQGDRLLAGTAEQVTRRVERLLGLKFEHFIKCVVLPQGEFARFLHEKPRDRQALLVEVLDLKIFKAMAALAGGRHASQQSDIASLEERLEEDYPHATVAGRDAAALRLQELEDLKQQIEQSSPFLEALEEKRQTKLAAAQGAAANLASLRRLQPPPGVSELASALAETESLLEKARSDLLQSTQELEAEESRVEELPEEIDLLRSQAMWSRHQTVQAERDDLTAELLRAREREKQAKSRVESAQQLRDEVRGRLEAARTAHAAHHIAAHLQPGEPCPVCRRKLAKPPPLDIPPDLSRAEEDLAKAEGKWRNSLQAASEASANVARLLEQRDRLRENLDQLEKDLTDRWSARRTEQLLARRQKLHRSFQQAREKQRELHREERSARKKLKQLRKDSDQAWLSFHQERDRLAVLKPPPLGDRSDLAGAWSDLVEWAGAMEPLQAEKESQAGKEAAQADREKRRLLRQLDRACRLRSVETDPRGPMEACQVALGRARQRLEDIERDLSKAKELRRKLKKLRRQAEVSKALARLLSARGFERWYLHRAMQQLVSGASRILLQLTREQFSLAVDDKSNFQVIDHNNARETRSARTLSGGETFLASMALALALSEHVAQLAAHGSPRLDSIFLDEGFGSLDSETLETVSDAIAELGAGGRTVGLVTHVRELAERVPVRYRVSKDDRTSRVERVVA